MLKLLLAAVLSVATTVPPFLEPDTIYAAEDNWALDRIYQPEGDSWTGGRLFRSDGFDWSGETYGAGITIYVMDSGLSAQEMFRSFLTGYTAIGGTTEDCGIMHGTRVASIIAAQGYGVAEQATIVPVRVLKCSGSATQTAIVKGLRWILANAIPETSVVNLSIGGSKSKVIDAEVKKLTDAGIPVVIAAGNNGSNLNRYSPSRVSCTEDLAISVGASTMFDLPWTGSNYGDCLTMYAPGVKVLASSGAGDQESTGTSFAAPYVAGAIAAYASAFQLSTEDAFYELTNYFDSAITVAARRDTTTSILQMFPNEDDWGGDYCSDYYSCWP